MKSDSIQRQVYGKKRRGKDLCGNMNYTDEGEGQHHKGPWFGGTSSDVVKAALVGLGA